MDSIQIITINENEGYNSMSVIVDPNGNLIVNDSDIADCLIKGESNYLDVSDMEELDLGDGKGYGKVYTNLSKNDPRFETLQEYVQGAGSRLHEFDPKLQDNYDEDQY